MIDVIPAISEKDWSQIEADIKLVAPYVSWVQLDISDGTLIPSTTFLDYSDPQSLKSLTNFCLSRNLSRESALDQSGPSEFPQISFEAHLLVASPEKYIKTLVDTGFKRLITHVEVNDPRLFLDQARFESVEIGIAIDGTTEIEQVEPFLEEVDCLLVMTAEAGTDVFLPETLEKIKAVRRSFADLIIEAEGGIDEKTAQLVIDAGATRLVPSSHLFKDPQKLASLLGVSVKKHKT